MKHFGHEMLDAPAIIIGQYTGGSSTSDVQALAQSMIDDRGLTSLAVFSLSPRPLDRRHPWLQRAPLESEWDKPVDTGETIKIGGVTAGVEDGLASMMTMPDPPAESCTIEYLDRRCVLLVLLRGVKMILPADFKDTFRQCKVLIIGQYDGTTMTREDVMREFFDRKNLQPFTVFRM